MLIRVAAAFLFSVVAGCVTPPAATTSPHVHDDYDVLATSEGGIDRFAPDALTTTVGAIRFHVGSGSHTVDVTTATGVTRQNSGNLDAGADYDVAFTQPGTYSYFCAYHSGLGPDGQRSGMVGSVTVA